MTLPRRTPHLALVAALLALASAPAAHAALVKATPVDGPTSAIHSLNGLDVSLDGGGGLVELRDEGGSPHVFVARVVGGAWQPIQRVDVGLDTPSSQPVIAAGEGGSLVVAFVNAGRLFAATLPAGGSAFGAPALVYGASAVSDPSIGLSVHAKVYIAFTAGGAGGHDVRVAFGRLGQPLAVVGAPLDAVPANDAGPGTARPRVAVAGDGLAVVVWGEASNVWARRVFGTSPSVVVVQASPPSFQGHPSAGADMPEVGIGDDDSFALVTFRQQFPQGTVNVARTLGRRLRGSAFDDPAGVDGLGFPAGESAQPARVSLDGLGSGMVAVSLTSSHQTWLTLLDDRAELKAPQRVDSDGSGSITYPVAARGRDDGGLVAWQRDGGLLGRQVLARVFDGTVLGSPGIITDTGLGSSDAAAGLEASGDRIGDVAVAFIQGSGAARRVVAGGYDRPPSVFGALTTTNWTRRRQPVLVWGESTDLWGGASYAVTLDGQLIGTTRATHLAPATPLADGNHVWLVVARDRQGQETSVVPRRLRIDATAPTFRARVSGRLRVGGLVRVRVSARDLPPPPAPGALAVPTSGVGRITIDFRDGSSRLHGKSATHRYAKRGRYNLRVTVRDRAGNVTVLKRRLTIAKAAKKKK